MSDHPLVSALSDFLETHKLESGLLLVPGDGELRLIGSGVGLPELIGISRSLDGYIRTMIEPAPTGKPN